MNDALLELAGREAEALRHAWIGVEHLLLALGAGAGPAARALDDVDVCVAPPGDGQWRGATMTPALQETLAFVDGYAGAREPTAEDALVAVLWLHPERLDGRREEAAERLRSAGVAVPELPPPPAPVEWGEEVRVPLSRLGVALRAATGHKVVLACDDAEARLRAERGFDLAAAVAGALAARP